jgi:hypothetical protein
MQSSISCNYPGGVETGRFSLGAGVGWPPYRLTVWLIPCRDESQQSGAPEQGGTDRAGAEAASAGEDVAHLLQAAGERP